MSDAFDEAGPISPDYGDTPKPKPSESASESSYIVDARRESQPDSAGYLNDYLSLKRRELELLREADIRRAELPHLYGHKFYEWQERFFSHPQESTSGVGWRGEKIICCTAANQCGKSTSAIVDQIRDATEPERWPELWPEFYKKTGQTPTSSWYLYPTADIVNAEFEEKWKKFYLPRGRMRTDPRYGWKDNWAKGDLESISFNTGWTIYFKTYGQGAHSLQAGSPGKVTADEELDEHLYSELERRVSATDGYLRFVFTATKGQQFWREVVEDRTRLTEANIVQVSLYDCLTYADGSPGAWTLDRIKRAEARCATEAERLKRIMGRFVVDEGRKYPTFERARHIKPYHPVPKSWLYYAGVDYGGGGDATSKVSHPSAIVILAVDPEFTRARVVRGWRGDGVLTTADDVVKKYVEMTTGMPPLIAAYYDWAAKDLGTIAQRLGLPFVPAEKSHEIGGSTLNTLFKNDALIVYEREGDKEVEKLARELEGLLAGTNKKVAVDDFCDALRYSCAKISWNWEKITSAVPKAPEPEALTDEQEEMQRRRGLSSSGDNAGTMFEDIEREMNEWSELY